ncbi:MAG TPA: SulP family inorganic anion transporter [Bryocella sp.]|nr:SulP family inorganic anion transporter [Bryocella sp.]
MSTLSTQPGAESTEAGQPNRGWRPFQSLRPLRRKSAVRDVLAGVQLAAMNIPQVLGYTRIAGMPVVTGLYTLLLPPVGFAALGSSRYLVVAADSATAAIIFSGLSGMAPVASPRYVELAGLVALLTALLLLLARLLKLGFLADFLSRTVLVGFLTGVGFQVGIAVLGGMLGLDIGSHRTLGQLAEVIRHLDHLHWQTLAVSAVVVTLILSAKWFAPKVPVPLIVVIAGIAASRIWDFAGHNIEVIGPIAGGLPHFVFPLGSWREIEELIAIAASCFVMIVTQSAATARLYAERHDMELDENADLLGLSAANALAGISGTFVVNGSPTQTAMVESSGASSELAQISTSMVVALVLLVFTWPLQYLPRAVLSAIVFVIAVKLIDFGKLLAIRRESPGEYWLAVMTAAVVIVVGVKQGILVAMVVSLLRIVSHSYHPHTGVLVADAVGWKRIPPAPGAMTEPGLVVYAFGAPLFYANASRFAEEVRALVAGHPSPVRWLIVDCEAITNVDYTAARIVDDLQHQLTQAGVRLGFARMAPSLTADFDRHHITDVVGRQLLFQRLHDAVHAYERLQQTAPPSPR